MKLREYCGKVWHNAAPADRYAHRKGLFRWLCDQDILDASEWCVPEDRDDEMHLVENCTYCEYYEEYYYDGDGFYEVTTSRRGATQWWCEGAVNNHAFYCSSSERYFSNDAFTCVEVDYSNVCFEWNECSLFEWNDGTYHWEAEYDDDDDEDDDSSSDPRSGYHSDHQVRDDWRREARACPTDVFGVELEMRAKDSSALQYICNAAAVHGFIAERDGSLDSRYGVEICAGPQPLREYRNGSWSAFLLDVKGKGTGWDAGVGYGIHISINRKGLPSRLQQAKFLRFFRDNRPFCELVAGRQQTGYCLYEPQPWMVGLEGETNKYLACSIRSRDRIEVRIFRSTLKFESFLKNVQFVAALVEFVRHNSASRNTAGEFIKFVKHKSRRNRYRELLAFLNAKGVNESTYSVSE